MITERLLSIGNDIEESRCDLCRADGRRSTRGTDAALLRFENVKEVAKARRRGLTQVRCQGVPTIRVGCRLVASHRSFDDSDDERGKGEGRHTGRAIATDAVKYY